MSDLADNKIWNTLLSKQREFVIAAFAERDRRMIGVIEAIEGRVPTNDEIKTYGALAIHQDGREEWKWRGKTICVTSPRWPMFGAMEVLE